MTLGTFYFMSVADGWGVAFASATFDSIECIPERGEVTHWMTPEFMVKHGEFDSALGDYVNSDEIVRLCSRRLKDLLDRLRSEVDKVQWLSTYVTDGTGERTEHFVLHFPEPPDVLNLDAGETLFDRNSGVLIRPCISTSKAATHKVFNIPGMETATIVHADVKKAIEDAGMMGLEFSPIRTR